MKRFVPSWLVQLTWYGAGIFATGAVWYFMSREDKVGTATSSVAAVVLTVVAVQLHRLNDSEKRLRLRRERLAQYLKEGESLLRRENEVPLPIQPLDDWITRVEAYLTDELDASYAARLGNFSGMTLYGDVSPKSSFHNSVDGRCRRLHEFIAEFSE